jgi:protein N-lysine methyltransferase METTL21D
MRSESGDKKKKIKVQKRIREGGEERKGSGKATKRNRKENVSRLPRGLTMRAVALPAHHTSHLQSLNYHFLAHSFLLLQPQDGISTGTALWLGAQCLSAYLATVHKIFHSRHTRPRVLELGSGIGLAAFVLSFFLCLFASDDIYNLAMHALGWDVLATDTAHTISSVLSPNIASNHPISSSNIIQIRELDWLVPPESWDWTNPIAVASTNSSPSSTVARADDPTILRPPFDLIISSDTIYTAELVQPLLRALHAAVTASGSPPVYICIERRDPALLDRALAEAKDVWGFTATRIGHGRVSRAMEKAGLKWTKEDWAEVEIWKLKLKNV